ncbi:MAG: hypothetical protein K2X43_11295, partial [Hyphomonadaceae bacterium]|nr:hypothetical protein [Hyphomonadaceae bacterium]
MRTRSTISACHRSVHVPDRRRWRALVLPPALLAAAFMLQAAAAAARPNAVSSAVYWDGSEPRLHAVRHEERTVRHADTVRPQRRVRRSASRRHPRSS